MNKILIVVHSYFMLLTAIQLRDKMLHNDCVDLVLSNASAGSYAVKERIEEVGLFDNVYYLTQETLYPRTSKIKKCVHAVNTLMNDETMLKKAGLDIETFEYDLMFCYVPDKYIEQLIFNVIKKYNPKAKCHLFEEGYISYFSEEGIFSTNGSLMHKAVKAYMSLSKKNKDLISNNITAAWFFRPELVQYKKYDVKKIPIFSRNESKLLHKINHIFSFDRENCDFKEYRYIYLEDCSYADGWETDDFSIISEILDDIERESMLIVKLHPRSPDNRFEKLNIISSTSTYPLEVLAINGMLEGKILITINSGAPLQSITCVDTNCKILFLNKISKYPQKSVDNEQFIKYLADIKKILLKRNIITPTTHEELKEIVADENNSNHAD